MENNNDSQSIISPVILINETETQSDSDSVWVADVLQSGNGFDRLYMKYCEQIFRYHIARTGDKEEAQDLTSQTFIAALERLSSFRAEGSFAAWLFSIAHHKLVDHYRRKKRIEASSQAVLETEQFIPIDEIMQNRSEFSHILAAMDRLNDERAEAVRLRFFGGLKSKEVATVMGKSESAVKMLVLRGLNDLRASLAYKSAEGR